MKTVKIIRNTLFSITVATFLTACGGGSGSDGNTEAATNLNTYSNTITGQFIDGPVKGLNYECSSGNTGVTNENGEYTCQSGDTVVFKVGKIYIGEAMADSVVTPETLYPDNPEAAINVAQLLQTLDDDGDLNNFVIDEIKADYLDDSLDFTSPSFDEEANNMLGHSLVDEASAIQHMKEHGSITILKSDKKDTGNTQYTSSKEIVDAEEVDIPVSISEKEEPSINEAVVDDIPAPEASKTENSDDAVDSSVSDVSHTEGTVKSSESSVSEGSAVETPKAETSGSGVESPVSGTPQSEEPVKTSVAEDSVSETPKAEESGATIEDSVAEDMTVALECKSGPAIQQGKVTDSRTGEPLANVEVSIGGCKTVTDENGLYTLKNIAESERAVVNFKHTGYYENSAVILVKHYSTGTERVSPNYLEYAIDPIDGKKTVDSQVDNVISAAPNAQIELAAGTVTDASGEVYSGKMVVEVAYGNPFDEKDKFTFPGLYEGIDTNGETVLFASYGYLSVALKDENGRALKLADDMIITFPATGNIDVESIPLWYYDYNKGKWIEDGYAVRQEDGTYQGMVSHAGTWSIDMPLEKSPGIYRAHVIYENGNPVRDARVDVMGPNWIQTDLTTDGEGLFEIKVIPGQDFGLKAYNYKWKYGAVYNSKIGAIASGEIVEDKK